MKLLFSGSIGIALGLLGGAGMLMGEEKHHHHGTLAHLQIFNYELDAKFKEYSDQHTSHLMAFDVKDRFLGDAFSESFKQEGYNIYQNLNYQFKRGRDGMLKKIPDGAGVIITKKQMLNNIEVERTVLEAQTDFFYPHYPHQVIGHDRTVAGINEVVQAIQAITGKRAKCQKKVGLPASGITFEKDEKLAKKLEAVRSPVSDLNLPLCAEPIGDLQLLATMSEATLQQLQGLMQDEQFEAAQELLNGAFEKNNLNR